MPGPDFPTIPRLPFIPLLPPRNDTVLFPKCGPDEIVDIKTGRCIPRPTPPTPVPLPEPPRSPFEPCGTDEECENPPPCPPGYTRSGRGAACARPFSLLPAITNAFQFFLPSANADVVGAPSPRRSPGPSRRRAPRRRTPAPKRPPARTPRTKPVKRPPGAPRGPVRPRKGVPWPEGFPAPTLNPIDFVLEQYRLLTRPLGEPTTNPRRRGGYRTRMPPTRMPPVKIPVPASIPVELPPPPARRMPSSVPSPSPSPTSLPTAAPSPRPGSRAIPRARTSPTPGLRLAPLLSTLLAPLFSVPSMPLSLQPFNAPSARPTPRPVPRTQPSSPVGDPLGPVQQPALGFATTTSPAEDPCAVRVRKIRREQRRRRKECKRFTTKTIRVCADK